MCFFGVTGGTIAAIVFYHGNGLHGNYRSFTAVKIPRGNPRGKPWFFPWCYGCFVLLRFRLYAFVEAAALRSIVLRYAGAPIATRVSFSFFGDVAFSEYFFVPFLLSLCMESTSYVLSFRMVFFFLVTTGWIFDINFCENSINQSIKVVFRVGNQYAECEVQLSRITSTYIYTCKSPSLTPVRS